MGGDPEGTRTESWRLSSHWSGYRVVNGLQHTTSALTWSDNWLDRPNPINQLVLAPTFIPTILLNLHLQQVPNPYFLGARKWWLRINCVERIEIWPVLRTWNWQWLKNLPTVWVYWLCISISTKANGFPPWYIPYTNWILWWVVEHNASKKRATQKTVKKTRNGNLLIKVDHQKKSESILKMKTFHMMKCRAYPHEKLNTSKGVIKSRELALTTEEEIASALIKRRELQI